MAVLMSPKSDAQMKRLGVVAAREEYSKLAKVYKDVLNSEYMICPVCGEWSRKKEYYTDKRTISGRFPICKSCVRKMVEQRQSKDDPPNETKESVSRVLHMMDAPYIDSLYDSYKEGAKDPDDRYSNSIFSPYITAVKSLPQYKDKTWKHSEFPEDAEEVTNDIDTRKPRKNIKKLFGSGFTDSDYLYLQDQYDDWVNRTQVDSKSQETYIVRICFKLLDIWKAQKEGKDTTAMDKSLNDLMAAANLQPKQNVGNAATDSLSFGQLIERWETEKPISEPAPEFKDVDGIGKYIRVFFAGHLAKALGLKNAYSDEYDRYMESYTVAKASDADDGGSNEIYNKLFGMDGD